MSLKLMTKAFDIRVGNHLRKLVLIKLADNASDQGECWPSYGYIANQCECSKSAVREHIAALIELGLVSKENRLGGNAGKGNKSNVYRLNLDNPVPPESTPPMSYGDTPMPSHGTPVPPESTPPMPPRGTRICHSFEPVKEPVIEPNSIGTPAKAAEPSRNAKQDYSPEFEAAWQAYPKRSGGNPKPSAWKAWSARIREGVKPADMLAGVQRYAGYITATGKAGTEYVKQAATFFGPDHHFAESWTAPPSQQRITPAQSRHSGFSERDYGTTQTPSWSKGAQ